MYDVKIVCKDTVLIDQSQLCTLKFLANVSFVETKFSLFASYLYMKK